MIWFGWYHGVSSLVRYFLPNTLFTYIIGLVIFYGISSLVGYLMPNPHYTYSLNIYDLVCFMAYQPLWLFNAKSILYKCI